MLGLHGLSLSARRPIAFFQSFCAVCSTERSTTGRPFVANNLQVLKKLTEVLHGPGCVALRRKQRQTCVEHEGMLHQESGHPSARHAWHFCEFSFFYCNLQKRKQQRLFNRPCQKVMQTGWPPHSVPVCSVAHYIRLCGESSHVAQEQVSYEPYTNSMKTVILLHLIS